MADLVYPGQTAGGPINAGSLPANWDIVAYRGDPIQFYIKIKDQATGNPVDISTMTPKAQLRTSYSDPSAVDFVCSLTGDPGVVRIFMSSSVTKDLLPGAYIYDIQLTDGSGENKTYLTGDVTISPDVTR